MPIGTHNLINLPDTETNDKTGGLPRYGQVRMTLQNMKDEICLIQCVQLYISELPLVLLQVVELGKDGYKDGAK